MSRSASLLAAAALAAALSAAQAEPWEFSSASALDTDYNAGKAAIDKKNWGEAVRRFTWALQRDPTNADLHNYLGYSYRNLKQMDTAFAHYRKAIELNPRHRGAHEYMGEAYLLVNDLPSAEKHVAALKEICLLSCDELVHLEKAVAQYRSKPN